MDEYPRRTVPTSNSTPTAAPRTGSVAAFIDWDNFAIGLREEMPSRVPDLRPVLRWVQQFGPMSICRAYGEWREPNERLAVYTTGVEVVYVPVLPLNTSPQRGNGGKSLADTAMAVDCVDLLHLVNDIATLVIVSSDKDLIPILRFAQRRGVRVLVVGSDRTATALRDQADESVTYRTLLEQEGEIVAAPPVQPGVVPPGRFVRGARLAPSRGLVAPPPVASAEPARAAALDQAGSTSAGAPTPAARSRRRGRRRRGIGSTRSRPTEAAAAVASQPEPAAPTDRAPLPPIDQVDNETPTPLPAAAASVLPSAGPAEGPDGTEAPDTLSAPIVEAPTAAEPPPAAAPVLLPGEKLARFKRPQPSEDTPPVVASAETPEPPGEPAGEQDTPVAVAAAPTSELAIGEEASKETSSPEGSAAKATDAATPAEASAPATRRRRAAKVPAATKGASEEEAATEEAPAEKPAPRARRRTTRRRSSTRPKAKAKDPEPKATPKPAAAEATGGDDAGT